jgi:trehalose-6-phosphatase
MANEAVEIRHGRKIIEVSAAKVSKGAAVRRLLKEHPYELALCAGDDQTDESMFEIEAPRLISIKVGPHASRAKYRLANPAGFRKFFAVCCSNPPARQMSRRFRGVRFAPVRRHRPNEPLDRFAKRLKAQLKGLVMAPA